MNTVKRFPIRFDKLFVGSRFNICAEPSRGVRHSSDVRTYVKKAESHSVEEHDVSHAVILMPNDLVFPLSRGKETKHVYNRI